jgi:Holliday junction resolvase
MAKKINSNKKGKVAELEVAHLIQDYGFIARRGQQFAGGNDSPDVVSNLGLHIEVKRVEAFNLYKAVEQATTDCNSLEYAIFHRKSGKAWQVIQDARTFLFHKEYVRNLEDNYKKVVKENELLKTIEDKFNALTR